MEGGILCIYGGLVNSTCTRVNPRSIVSSKGLLLKERQEHLLHHNYCNNTRQIASSAKEGVRLFQRYKGDFGCLDNQEARSLRKLHLQGLASD